MQQNHSLKQHTWIFLLYQLFKNSTQSIKSHISSQTISQPLRILLEITYQPPDNHPEQPSIVTLSTNHIFNVMLQIDIECAWLVYSASLIPSCLTDVCVLWIRPCLSGSWADGSSDVVWWSEEVSSRSTSARHPFYGLHWDDAHRSRWVSIGLLHISISSTALKLSWDLYDIVLIHINTAMWIIGFTPGWVSISQFAPKLMFKLLWNAFA